MKITLIPQRCRRTKRPLPLRRVRADGRHVGFICDVPGSPFLPYRHMSDADLLAIMDGINDAGGKCGSIGMKPPSAEQLRAQRAAENLDEDEDGDE